MTHHHRPHWLLNRRCFIRSSSTLSVSSFYLPYPNLVRVYETFKNLDTSFITQQPQPYRVVQNDRCHRKQRHSNYCNRFLAATTKPTFQQSSKKKPIASSSSKVGSGNTNNSNATVVRNSHDPKSNITASTKSPPPPPPPTRHTKRSTPNKSLAAKSSISSSRSTNSSSSSSNSNTNDFRAKLRATQQQVTAANIDKVPFPPISQSYLDYLFAECVAHDEWDLAIIDVMDLMKETQMQVQYSTYNACLQACFQVGNAGPAMQILQTMESLSNPNMQPQINDYTLVLLAMCRNDQSESGWCQKAIRLLNDVKINTQQDVPITVYDAILARLTHDRQWKTSVQILQSMEDNRNISSNTTQPLLSTYRTVIECCVAANQGDVAYRVLKSYIQQGRQLPSPIPPQAEGSSSSSMPMPTSYLFEMVIVTLSKSTQQWRRAVQLLDNMLEWNVPRTLLIYNSILIACSKAREPIAAKSLLQRMKRYDHPHIKPNIISYNTAIAACCATHQYWRDALTIFDQMQREPGVTPDICTYTKYVFSCP